MSGHVHDPFLADRCEGCAALAARPDVPAGPDWETLYVEESGRYARLSNEHARCARAVEAGEPADRGEGLREACRRSVPGLLCESHGRALWPSLAVRCNGWIALAAQATPAGEQPE